MYATIRRYIILEFIFSFIVSFLFFFFIFFVNQLLLLAEEILSKNVSLKNVFFIILYSLPAITSFTFPFASLVGSLMAVSRLSSDNEILAFQASGIQYKTLLVPLLVMGIVLSSFSFLINDYFLPLSTIKFSRLYRDILYSTPELELDSYSIKKYQNTTLITGKVTKSTIHDMVIIDRTAHKNKRIITASRATLVPSSLQKGISSILLKDVFSITPENMQRGKFSYFFAESMLYNILLKNISFSIKTLTPREMSARKIYRGIIRKKRKLKQRKTDVNKKISLLRPVLWEEYSDMIQNGNNINTVHITYDKIKKLENTHFFDRSLQIYTLEFYKKFSIPFACFLFILFAFPLSLYSRKSGRSTGFGIGLLVSVFYWSLLFAGQTFGIRMNISPFIAMWSPDILILCAGIVLMVKRYKR